MAIVLVDQDGCLTDHNTLFMERLNAENGTAHRYDEIVAFHYPNLTPEEKARVFEYWNEHDLYDDYPPEPGALEALEELRKHHTVIAVSSPLPGSIQSKYSWLMEVAGFDRKDIVLATDKTLVKGNILIDDATHNLTTFPLKTLCFSRPWNRRWSGPRVDSWEAVPEMVARVLKGGAWR